MSSHISKFLSVASEQSVLLLSGSPSMSLRCWLVFFWLPFQDQLCGPAFSLLWEPCPRLCLYISWCQQLSFRLVYQQHLAPWGLLPAQELSPAEWQAVNLCHCRIVARRLFPIGPGVLHSPCVHLWSQDTWQRARIVSVSQVFHHLHSSNNRMVLINIGSFTVRFRPHCHERCLYRSSTASQHVARDNLGHCLLSHSTGSGCVARGPACLLVCLERVKEDGQSGLG